MIYIEEIRNKYRQILENLGAIAIGFSVVAMFPLLVLPFYPDERLYAKYFVLTAAISLITGAFLRIRFNTVEDSTLNIQDGAIIVLISWLYVIYLSSLPFYFAGLLDFSQSMFEAVSGWTTTGLSVMNVEKTPSIYLIWRSITQFLGGAGIAVVMLTSIIGPSGMRYYNAEGRTERLLPNIKKTTRLIMTIYMGYMAAGTILYFAAGMPLFDALNHSMAALSTGGFSVKNESIAYYSSLRIEIVSIVLMLLGTTSFAASYLIIKKEFKKFSKIGEMRFQMLMITVSVPVMMIFSLNKIYPSLSESLRVSIFQLVSAISSTGFATVSYVSWDSFGVFMMTMLMIVGGSTGSTAGGMKIYRFYLMIKAFKWHIESFFLPENVVEKNYIYTPEGKKFIEKQDIIQVFNFGFLYIMTFFAGTFALSAQGFTLRDSMFEFASSLSTIGLSIGITSPEASPAVLWTEIAGMFLGRLELMVIIYAVIKIIKDIRYAGEYRQKDSAM